MDNSPVKSRPELKFRVLILGRANAGKTTILERIAGAAVSDAEVWRGGKRLPAQVGWSSF
jgi:GTPase SAR1 family protein